ncbi:MAG: ATP-dependent DNA helicase RecG, partial [Bacteroidaceae bacterium]|nr:ATP-dependent DNA helicase RecG [Bacteroidaceae bacterium]
RQLGSLPVKVALLTGNVTGKKRREILQETADGTIQILVGTHALIEPTVQFLNLGLAIIDEQHRFGVKQRAKLWQKNVKAPHVLVMTATPIPRTLAMTVYGDLDVSVIDQLPPGRKPIQTLHYFETDTARLYQGLRIELQRGRQAYIVYPLIEESEKSDLQSIEEGYATFTDAFPDFKVGMVHGRMKPALKDSVMAACVNKEIYILISTTVIEVGVNVPNASVMVIEDADRFGLAQLHQLRGRVGRGAEQSYCILVTRRKLSDNTSRRMDIMVESTDGFYIAEEDMKLRGPGDLEGTQQSGIPFRLRLANVITDSVLMSEAREAAANILEADPHLEHENHRIIAQQLQKTMREKENFSDIS